MLKESKKMNKNKIIIKIMVFITLMFAIFPTYNLINYLWKFFNGDLFFNDKKDYFYLAIAFIEILLFSLFWINIGLILVGRKDLKWNFVVITLFCTIFIGSIFLFIGKLFNKEE